MKQLLLLALTLLATSKGFSQNSWLKKADLTGGGRWHAFGFSIGNKGYIGAGTNNRHTDPSNSLDDFWEYDPATDTWSQLPGPM